MTEKEKIKKLLKEHKSLLKVTNMDVAESMKGQWFFIRYDKENDFFEALVRFETAKELAEILAGELSTDILATIDAAPEEPPKPYNFANNLEMEACYKPYIERLIAYMNE